MPQPRCVLLVDDDPTTNYLNAKLLTRLDGSCHVLTTRNGQEALALINARCRPGGENCPDLIFLDVNMPRMNGFDFLDAYRQLTPRQQCATVVVMLTSSLHPRDVERARRLPVSGFLLKPLTAEKISQVIHDHFPPPPGT